MLPVYYETLTGETSEQATAGEDTTAGVVTRPPEGKDKRAKAKVRQQWRESPERRKFIKKSSLIVAIAFIIYIATAVLRNFQISENLYFLFGNTLVWPLLFASRWLLPFATLVGILAYRQESRNALQDRISLGLVSALQKEESQLAEKGTDFDSLWAITQKRIGVYHEIATQQSRRSFRSAQIAAYGGFAFLLGVAIFAGLSKGGTAAIAASVVGVAAAGLSGYIGSTFIKAQTSSSEQLGAYFMQPVEFARALAAERLLEKVEEADRGKIVDRIVQSMTLVGAPEPGSGEKAVVKEEEKK